MKNLIKIIVISSLFLIGGCKPNNNSALAETNIPASKKLSIGLPPAPASTIPIPSLQLFNLVQAQTSGFPEILIFGTGYDLVDKPFIDKYSEWYFNILNSYHLIYNIKTVNCVDFSLLYAGISPIQVANSPNPEKAHLAIGLIIVEQINEALGVGAFPDAKTLHSLNCWVATDYTIYLIDPQSQESISLKDYPNKDHIIKIFFF